jgi:hypothetical protein
MRYKRCLLATLLASLACAVSAPATEVRAASEIVVSLRYLLPVGTSHAHLFLYREDGRLLRQLTRDDSGQDFNPVFSPDGETIVFTREKPKDVREFWSIHPRGGGLTRLKEAPFWYRAAKNSPGFTNVNDSQPPEATSVPLPRYRSRDGAVEIALRVLPDDADGESDGPGHGKNYLVRDLKRGNEAEAGKLPGFEGLYDLLLLRQDPGQHFLIENGLRLAFFGLHLDSTAGDTDFALDISRPLPAWRLVRLSPNWATPFPLPGEPAFLTLTSVRYVPITNSAKTANSSYIERWDAALHKVRFARPGAAIAYGASMYRPDKSPAVVTILRED